MPSALERNAAVISKRSHHGGPRECIILVSSPIICTLWSMYRDCCHHVGLLLHCAMDVVHIYLLSHAVCIEWERPRHPLHMCVTEKYQFGFILAETFSFTNVHLKAFSAGVSFPAKCCVTYVPSRLLSVKLSGTKVLVCLPVFSLLISAMCRASCKSSWKRAWNSDVAISIFPL